MDQCMVSAGDLELDVEDEVVIIGSQGKEEITAEEVAERLSTVSHEVLCAVSKRVPRVYLSEM